MIFSPCFYENMDEKLALGWFDCLTLRSWGYITPQQATVTARSANGQDAQEVPPEDSCAFGCLMCVQLK
jgi:hypothetical protein